MTERIRWGVVGSGGIAKRRTIPEGIIPASNGELKAVFDVQVDVNNAIAKEYNAYAASSLEDLLHQDIDAVYIATPANLHRQQTLQCARAGKHILCEKPLGLSVAEAVKMIQICEDSKVFLGTALMMRFHSQHQAALALIRGGQLGKPVYARAQLSCWYPPIPDAWRQDPTQGGGGSLIDMGGHCIDLLEMFFGQVVSVCCFTRNTIHSYSSEDSAVVILSFANGALATVDAFFCIPDASSQNRLELYGSQGSILAQGTIGQGEAGETIAFLEGKDAGYNAQQARGEGGGVVLSPPPINMYKAEIEEFGNAIRVNRIPANSAELGLRNQRILSACYESAKTRQVIQV